MREDELEEKKPLVSIIVLNYNAGELLQECIQSIINSNYKNFEIILVDNVSNDYSHKKCKERFKDIILIENEKNLGYCGGNNVGIKIAKGEYFVILNPDVIVEPDWLNQLLISYSKNGEGFYQPKILADIDHRIIISTGNMIQLFGFGYSRGKGEKDNGQYENDEEIGYASGTCLFASSKTFKKIGNFDDYLFAYHDDLDLCWRGQLQGIKSFYVHKSVVFHPLEGYSFKWNNYKFFLMERNRMYCLIKNFSKKSIIKLIPALILVEIAVSLFYWKKGFLLAKIRANLDILKNLKKINKNYKIIQKTRIKSDEELIINFTNKIEIPRWVLNKNSNNKLDKIFEKLSKISKKKFN